MEKTEIVGFEDRDDGFVLVRYDGDGRRTEMFLSAANLRSLQAILQKQVAIATARRVPPVLAQAGIDAIVPWEVVRMRLNTDLHQTMIHLGIEDRYGNEFWLAFRPDDAQTLHDYLPRWIERARSQPKQ